MGVMAAVGELVGIAEAHVEHLRVLFLQGFEGHAEGDAVQALALFEAAVGNAGVNVLHHAGNVAVRVGRLVGTAARETAAVVVHCEADALPGGVHHHLPLVAGILVNYLQHAYVRVRLGVVGIDPLVIGPAAEHFAVARIGEVHGVVHLHPAVLGAVAKQVAVLGGIAPYKGHEGLTASLRRISPVFGLQGVYVFGVLGIVDESLVGPAEELLPAQAVERDDYETGVIPPFAAGDQRHQRQHSYCAPFFHDNLLVNCVLR